MNDDLAKLVTDAQSGDTAAFDALVRAFQDRAVGYAYAVLGDFHQAEDVAQEAFLEAFRSLPSLSAPEAFPGWLRTIVRHRCGRVTRRQQVATVPIDADLDRRLQAESTEDVVMRRTRQRIVHEAIAGLPETQREATVLYYINDHSQEEIAAFLQITPNAVKKRLHAGRALLRERLLDMVEDTLKDQRPSRDESFERRVRLFRAIDNGDVDAVRSLLDEAPSLIDERRRRDEDCPPSVAWGVQWGVSPLILAAGRGDVAIVRLLIERGADIEARDSDGPNVSATPLHWAARAGQLDVVKLLVEVGANTQSGEQKQERSAAASGLANYREDIAEYLIQHGAQPTIFTAVAHNWLDDVRRMVAGDASVLAARLPDLDLTPLHVAARKNLPDMIDLLVELGAVVGTMDKQGRLPIDLALIPGHAAAYDRLTEHGAVASPIWMHACGSIGRAGLMERLVWASGGDVATVNEILGVDPSLASAKIPGFWPDSYCGATALHFAAWTGQREIADILIAHGADVSQKDERYGGTPAGWAAENHREDMVEFLMSRGGARH